MGRVRRTARQSWKISTQQTHMQTHGSFSRGDDGEEGRQTETQHIQRDNGALTAGATAAPLAHSCNHGGRGSVAAAASAGGGGSAPKMAGKRARLPSPSWSALAAAAADA